VDGENPGAIRTIDVESGEVSTLITTPADLQTPSDIEVSNTTAYIADGGTNRVVAVDVATGTLKTIVENPNTEPPGMQDGSGAAIRLNMGEGSSLALTHDRALLFLAEPGNNAIRAIHVASGQVETLAGNISTGFSDGVGKEARFATPLDIALNDAGDALFVADTGNNALRAVNIMSGNVTTVVTGLAAPARIVVLSNISLLVAQLSVQTISALDLVTQTLRTVSPVLDNAPWSSRVAFVALPLAPHRILLAEPGQKQIAEVVISGLCAPCRQQSISPQASVGNASCVCIAGFSGPHGGPCVPCQPGSFKAANGSAACSPCPAHAYAPAGVSVCTSCPPGSGMWKPNFATVQEEASWLEIMNVTRFHNRSDCSCLHGYIGPDGGPCSACPAGKYKAHIGTFLQWEIGLNLSSSTTECLWCSAATYSDRRASSSCSNCSVCALGSWSTCTLDSPGNCTACNFNTKPIIFTSAGINRISPLLTQHNSSDNTSTNTTMEMDVFWRQSHNCTKTTMFAWGAWTQILRRQCYSTLHLPNSCSWQCGPGYFLNTVLNTGQTCEACSTTQCPRGQFRAPCSLAADGQCVVCTNPPLPDKNSTVYASPGVPYDMNNCGIRCADGLFPTVDLNSTSAVAAALASGGPAICAPCNNPIPANSTYSHSSLLVGVPVCPWSCGTGFVQDGAGCKRLTREESCALGSCPLPKMILSNVSASLANACYEWQYAQCDSAGGISCHTCLGVTSNLQGGRILHSLEGCDVGFYRAPCVNRCVFPDDGNVRGQCIACNNALDIHAVYTSPGTPHTKNNCSWTCAASYTKVSVDGREKCVKNSTLA